MLSKFKCMGLGSSNQRGEIEQLKKENKFDALFEKKAEVKPTAPVAGAAGAATGDDKYAAKGKKGKK